MKTISAGLLAEHVKASYRPYVRINIWDTDPNPPPASLLYFSPGRNPANSYKAELYSYDGANTPVLVWEGPEYVAFQHRWSITHLYPHNGKILIFMGNTAGNCGCRIYEFDPALGTATLRVDEYLPYAADGGSTSVIDAKIFGSDILLAHAGNAMPPVLMSLNPSDWSLTFIQRVDDYDDGLGGLLVHTDGYVYWNTGRYIYSSVTAGVGSFVQLVELDASWGLSNGLCAHTDDKVYAAARHGLGGGTEELRVFQIYDNIATVVYSSGTVAENQTNIVSIISTAAGVLLIPWVGIIIIGSDVIWGHDTTGTDSNTTPDSVLYLDKVYFGNSASGQALIRRDNAGSLVTVATYTGYVTYGTSYEDVIPLVVL